MKKLITAMLLPLAMLFSVSGFAHFAPGAFAFDSDCGMVLVRADTELIKADQVTHNVTTGTDNYLTSHSILTGASSRCSQLADDGGGGELPDAADLSSGVIGDAWRADKERVPIASIHSA